MMALSATELLAKEHFMNLVTKGRDIPMNAGTDGFNFDFGKPDWFDVVKYDLGREFFHENRAGILSSNMAGLILLLSVPNGLRILHGTGRSSTPPTARNRYIDTIAHTISWYDFPLDNSTKSWDSLKTVRRLHNLASYSSEKKNIGIISQMEVSFTTFGFAGFALLRPQFFGIQSNDQRKREGFLHFWAVLNYMLGVRDEFNICLLPMEAAEIEFDIIMRNVLGPYLQVETPLFKQMLSALIVGMQPYMPLLEYESQMFLTRRAVGIPGYQYNVKMDQERPHRNIFTDEELDFINVPLFRSQNIILLKVKERSEEDINSNTISGSDSEYVELLRKEFDLPETQTVRIKEVSRDEEEFMATLNSKKYNKLSAYSKMYLNLNLTFIKGLNNSVTRYVMEQFLGRLLGDMKKQQKNRKTL